MVQSKVLVIGTDGGRRDLILAEVDAGRAPNFARLDGWGQDAGMRSCRDQRVLPQTGAWYKPKEGRDAGRKFHWKTAPGWSAMCSGVDNRKTRVADNKPESLLYYWEQVKEHPSFLAAAHAKGHKVLACGRPNVVGALLSGKTCRKWDKYTDAVRREVETGRDKREWDQQIGILDAERRRGLIDYYQGILVDKGGPYGDRKNVDFALRHAKECAAMFVHLDSADQAGHAHGWGSTKQKEAIRFMDAQIGRLLDFCDRDRSADWLVLLTSDHGGRGYGHGEHEIFDQCIPFFSNKKLCVPKNEVVRQFDVAPTALAHLGIKAPRGTDGRSRLQCRATTCRGNQCRRTMDHRGGCRHHCTDQ